MDFPISYNNKPLVEDKRGKRYFEVEKLSPVQLKTLIATKTVTSAKGEGLPLYISSINESKLNITSELSSYINLYSMFSKQGLYLVDNCKKRTVTKEDLFNFIL